MAYLPHIKPGKVILPRQGRRVTRPFLFSTR
jgi:hypothetical protein